MADLDLTDLYEDAPPPKPQPPTVDMTDLYDSAPVAAKPVAPPTSLDVTDMYDSTPTPVTPTQASAIKAMEQKAGVVAPRTTPSDITGENVPSYLLRKDAQSVYSDTAGKPKFGPLAQLIVGKQPQEAPSVLRTFGTEAALSVVPTVSGVVGGQLVSRGAALAVPVTGGWSAALALGAGLLGSVGLGAAAEKLQSIVLKKSMGEDDYAALEQERALGLKANPISSFAGQTLPAIVMFRANPLKAYKALNDIYKMTKMTALQRKIVLSTVDGKTALRNAIDVAVGSGTQGGMEIYNQVQSGDYSAFRLIAAPIVGAILSDMRGSKRPMLPDIMPPNMKPPALPPPPDVFSPNMENVKTVQDRLLEAKTSRPPPVVDPVVSGIADNVESGRFSREQVRSEYGTDLAKQVNAEIADRKRTRQRAIPVEPPTPEAGGKTEPLPPQAFTEEPLYQPSVYGDMTEGGQVAFEPPTASKVDRPTTTIPATSEGMNRTQMLDYLHTQGVSPERLVRMSETELRTTVDNFSALQAEADLVRSVGGTREPFKPSPDFQEPLLPPSAFIEEPISRTPSYGESTEAGLPAFEPPISAAPAREIIPRPVQKQGATGAAEPITPPEPKGMKWLKQPPTPEQAAKAISLKANGATPRENPDFIRKASYKELRAAAQRVRYSKDQSVWDARKGDSAESLRKAFWSHSTWWGEMTGDVAPGKRKVSDTARANMTAAAQKRGIAKTNERDLQGWAEQGDMRAANELAILKGEPIPYPEALPPAPEFIEYKGKKLEVVDDSGDTSLIAKDAEGKRYNVPFEDAVAAKPEADVVTGVAPSGQKEFMAKKEGFALTGEKGIDTEAIAQAKIKSEQAAAAAEKLQGKLFPKTAPLSLEEAANAGKLRAPSGKGVPNDLRVKVVTPEGKSMTVAAKDADSLKDTGPYSKVELIDAKGKPVDPAKYSLSAVEPLSPVEIESQLASLKGPELRKFMKEQGLGKTEGMMDYAAKAKAKKSIADIALDVLEKHRASLDRGVMGTEIAAIGKAAYKAGIDIAIGLIKAGKGIKAGIDAAVAYMKKNGKGPFNEDAVRSEIWNDMRVQKAAIPSGSKEYQTITRLSNDGPLNKYAAEVQGSREAGTSTRPNKSIAEHGAVMAAKDTATLNQERVNPANPDRVLAGIEAYNRAATPEERQRIFDDMKLTGSDAAYVLRTMQELKGTTPEGSLDMVQKLAEKAGSPITNPKQVTRIKDLAAKDLAARQELKAAEVAAINDPSLENRNALEITKAKAEVANRIFMRDVANAMPKSVSDTLFRILQGNVMTPISHIYNLTGNIVNQPVRGAVEAIASGIDLARSALVKTPREISAPWIGRQQYRKAMWEARHQMSKIIREGSEQYGSAIAGEVMEGLHPARAWARLLGIQSRAENIRGSQKVSGVVSDIIEAFPTTGPAAEVTFRFLGAIDAPFKAAQYAKALAQIGYRKGLRGTELDTFKGTGKDQAASMDRALEAVYQQTTWATKAMGKLAGIGKDVPVVGKLLNFFARTSTGNLFVNTPVNIAGEWAQTAVPPLAFAKAGMEIKTGNIAAAERSIARGLIGTAIGAAAIYLVKQGLATGSGIKKGDEAELRKQSGQPSNTFNLSGLARLKSGGDPRWREGDRVVKYAYMGFPGLTLGMYANAGEALSEQSLKAGIIAEPTTVDLMKRSPMEVVTTIMQNLSMVKGQQIFYDGIMRQNYDKILQNMWNLYTSIPIPNTLATAEKTVKQYQTNVDSDSLMTSMENVLKQKLGMIDNLPPKRNLWGEPIASTPAGATPWVYQFLDFSKSQRIPMDEASKVIWDVVRAVPDSRARNDAIPGRPGRNVTVLGKPIKYTDKELDAREERIGKERKKLVLRYSPQIYQYLKNNKSVEASKLLARIYSQTSQAK